LAISEPRLPIAMPMWTAFNAGHCLITGHCNNLMLVF
jgi:hypothetical protein